MRGLRAARRLGLVLVVVGHAIPAVALPLVVTFTGTVVSVRDHYGDLDGSVVGGPGANLTPFTGRYRYSTSAPDLDPSSARGFYEPTGSIEVQVGSYTFASVGGVRVRLEDPPPHFMIGDTLQVSSRTTPGVSSDPALEVISISFRLFDLSGEALSSTDLPVAAPDLSHFGYRYIDIGIIGPSGFIGSPHITGILESMTLVVAEPRAALLFSAIPGVVAVSRLRRTACGPPS